MGATIVANSDGTFSAVNPDTEHSPGAAVSSSATGAAGAQVVATLAAAAGKLTHLGGFVVTTANPAAAVSGVVTVAGLAGGTLSFQLVEATATGGLLQVDFGVPMPASAANTAIVVTLPAIAAGAAGAVAAYGFQL